MTAPDKVWAWGERNFQWGPQWKCCPEPMGPTVEFMRTQYTRSDLSQAQVAAAYGDAAGIANSLLVRSKFGTGSTETQCVYSDFVGASIINATPADATAALQAMIDKAVAAERERCVMITDAAGLSSHIAARLAGDNEITTSLCAESYAKASKHIAAAIRKGAKP